MRDRKQAPTAPPAISSYTLFYWAASSVVLAITVTAGAALMTVPDKMYSAIGMLAMLMMAVGAIGSVWTCFATPKSSAFNPDNRDPWWVKVVYVHNVTGYIIAKELVHEQAPANVTQWRYTGSRRARVSGLIGLAGTMLAVHVLDYLTYLL